MQGSNEAYDLPDWAPLALSLAPPSLATQLDPLLRLHQHLSRVVRASSEAMLIQLRLAWWRDELRKEDRLSGATPADPLLAGLLAGWGRKPDIPVGLVDAWEGLLAEKPWPVSQLKAFVSTYADTFGAMADDKALADAASEHGACWATAELAMDGATIVDAPVKPLPSLPRNLRALAVIGGLSRRALKTRGSPLMGDRFSPLAAMRLGIFGR